MYESTFLILVIFCWAYTVYKKPEFLEKGDLI